MDYVAPNLKSSSKKLPITETRLLMEDETKVKTNSPYPPLESLETINCARLLPFKTPTLIQKHVIPALLNNHPILCRAPTGMGKTLCYLIPLVERLKYNQRGVQICVISPTRELCDQIREEALKISQSKALRVESVYGSKKSLPSYSGVDIVVAAPGRLLDLLNRGKIDFNRLDYFILDEADKLLEMGFERDIRAIKSFVKDGTHVSMFSATYHRSLANIIKDFLPDDHCSVEIENETLLNIKQTILSVPNKEKKLGEILSTCDLNASWRRKASADKILIFVERKSSTVEVEQMLASMGYNCVSIHGDKEQSHRTAALSRFKRGDIPILVATSVAARGIDIKDIKLVINYDFPKDIKEYIHRIGRTGREGKLGEAISFVEPSQLAPSLRDDLIEVLNESQNQVPSFLSGGNRSRSGQKRKPAAKQAILGNQNAFKKTEDRKDPIVEQMSTVSIKDKKGFGEKQDSDDDVPGEW